MPISILIQVKCLDQVGTTRRHGFPGSSDDPPSLESEGSNVSKSWAATLPRSLGIHSPTPIRRHHDDRESPFHLVALASLTPPWSAWHAPSTIWQRLLRRLSVGLGCRSSTGLGSTLASLILLIDLKTGFDLPQTSIASLVLATIRES